MTLTVRKTSALAAAALALGLAALPIQSAEARWRGHGGGALAAGLIGGAILGGALLARPAYGYGRPVYYGGPTYVEQPECYQVRRRVFDEYRGRWVMVRRTICD